ncbi:MAG: hypothetical protein ABI861_08805 [Panacibacter sp.]
MNIKIGALVIGGLAAYAYYRYAKMSVEEKREIVETLKKRGKEMYDEYMPAELKNTIGKSIN